MSRDNHGLELLEMRANAHLISAAPDMYESLKELFFDYTGGRNVGLSELGEKAEQALAKAEGK